ncbi:zinc finger protein aebp2-like [Polymixia lowei]
MAAVTTEGTEQDSRRTGDRNGAGERVETVREEEQQAPPDSKQEPGDNESGVGMDVNGGATTGEEEEEEEDKPSPGASGAVRETHSVNGSGEAECREAGDKLSEPGESPAERGSLGSSAAEPPRGEQREQSASSSPPAADCAKSAEEEKPQHRSKRRASVVEVFSSDGEPLSRMDSEDSIGSTLMDVESTASSGRSTPAMMNGHGGVAVAVGGSTAGGKSLGYTCCWDHCQLLFPSSPDLAEHIRAMHVDGQRGGVFVCLWKGCKVYNTPSTSQSWLQRHMLTHSGDKPFKCVVGGCNATFASQGGLARHVPTHFSSQSSSKLSSQGKVKEESPSKAGLNKRRKLKNKRRRSLPRPHDFFDAQTMDAIRHRAICLNLATHIESLGNGHSVVFHSTVIARRKEDSGKVKVLLHWTPEDILPDVWVNEGDRLQQKTKVVHLSKLPTDTAVLLDPNIYRMFF